MESFLFCRAYHLGDFDKVFAEDSAPDHFPRDRTFNVRHVRLDVAIDQPNREVRGTSTLLLTPVNDGLRDIELDGESLHVRKVTDGEGRSLDFDYDGSKLKVRLGRAYKADAEFSLKVAYDCRPRRGCSSCGRRRSTRSVPGWSGLRASRRTTGRGSRPTTRRTSG